MAFCIECHRNPEQRLRDPKDVFNLDSKRLAEQGAQGVEKGGKVRARLEGQTSSELLRLPSMKRKFEHSAPPESEQLTGPKYWRSLDELAGTPGFKAQLEREFPGRGGQHGGCRSPALHEDHGGIVRPWRRWSRWLPSSGKIYPALRKIRRGRHPGSAVVLRDRDADAQMGVAAAGRDASGPPDETRGQSVLSAARWRRFADRAGLDPRSLRS